MSISKDSKKDSFLLYLSHRKFFEKLDDKGIAELIKAIFDYVETGKEISTVNGKVEMAFMAIQDDIDRCAERYQRQCERNRENGKLGGRPKGNPQEPRKPSGFLDNPYDDEYDAEYDNKEKKVICCSEPETASETDLEPTVDEAESLFEELWEAYPQKRGKGSISKTTKKKLLKIGREQMLRAIDRYVSECNEQGRYYKNGSTFFNSGYVDYLDENYTPLRESIKPRYQKANALDEWMEEQKARDETG